jgi:hypothetical protein
MPMTCRQATCLVTEEREGQLSAWKRWRYRLHMAVCGRCQAYVRGFDQVLQALASLPPEPPPAALCDSLSERLRRRTAGDR